MRTINEIIIHCAATHPDWWKGRTAEEKRDEIRRWHMQDNGWNDIGYHWLIDRDGTVVAGRPEDVAGAHCKGRNANTLGVCLLGGHGSNENDAFDKHYTKEQDRALRNLLDRLQAKYGIAKISGHNEYAAKACPGFSVSRWLAHKTPAPAPAADKGVQVSTGQVVAGAGTVLTGAAALDGTAQIIVVALGAGIVILGLIMFGKELKAAIRRLAPAGGGEG